MAVCRVLRLLEGSRLLVAEHRFIQIKVILGVPLLQLLIEIRVGILIVGVTLIEHFEVGDAEVALVNLQVAEAIVGGIFLGTGGREMHKLIPLLLL